MCRAMADIGKKPLLDNFKTLRDLMGNLGWTAERAMAAMRVFESEKGILIKRI